MSSFWAKFLIALEQRAFDFLVTEATNKLPDIQAALDSATKKAVDKVHEEALSSEQSN